MGDWHLDHGGILEVTFVRGAILILKKYIITIQQWELYF